ncbi:MAG: AAA family ATPase [Clostridiales bacterium]|nr:AAA family ATPase [Clostridiales bacterium]
MKRKVIDALIELMNNTTDEDPIKPILLTGAKGVGKTYLAYDFAKAFFEDIVYYNFEKDQDIWCQLLHLEENNVSDEIPSKRVLILDEILTANGISSSDKSSWLNDADILKIISFNNKAKAFTNIIAISSAPIAKGMEELFNIVHIYPLEFDEFLFAIGHEWYIEVITTHFITNKKIPEIVHKELLALFMTYLQIGGMPAAINEYINMASLINIHQQHNYLISFYHDNFLANLGESDSLKMKQVFDSIPLQLLKANKKFQYNIIRKGTTYGMYKEAIDRLEDNHNIIRSYKISSNQLENFNQNFNNMFTMNNNHEENNSSFKLYFPDTGILYTKIAECIMKNQIDLKDLKLNEKSYKGIVLGDNELIDKGILENYVAQSLNSKDKSLAFWESDSMAKVDFLIRIEDKLIPIELHWKSNTRSKSISVLKQKYDFPYSIKISARNYGFTKEVKYIPYYAVFCL